MVKPWIMQIKFDKHFVLLDLSNLFDILVFQIIILVLLNFFNFENSKFSYLDFSSFLNNHNLHLFLCIIFYFQFHLTFESIKSFNIIIYLPSSVSLKLIILHTQPTSNKSGSFEVSSFFRLYHAN